MYHQLITLLKTNPFARLAVGASLGLLVLILFLSPHRPSSPSPSPAPLPSTTRPEIISLDDQARRAAAAYRPSIEGALPIYEENFNTSVGITTTLHLYILPDDPAETVRFEIYGLSYLNSDSSPFTNPNITAFKESFEHGLQLLKNHGVDPTKLIFIYGDKQYVRETTAAWVTKLGLLK